MHEMVYEKVSKRVSKMWSYFNSFITKDQGECLKSSNRPGDKLLYFLFRNVKQNNCSVYWIWYNGNILFFTGKQNK